MTVLNLRVSASGDDSFVIHGFDPVAGNALFNAGTHNSDMRYSLARWSVPVDQGQVIDIAYVELTAAQNLTATTVNTRWYGGAADNASMPTTWSAYDGMARTTAFTNWNGLGSWSSSSVYSSPSVVGVVQEIIDRGGWSSGNYLLLDWRDNGSSAVPNCFRSGRSYDLNSAEAPLLHIEYTTNTAPTITVNPSVNYNGYTRLGPSNTPGTVNFTATDLEQTGSNELSYEIRTASGSGGTLVASGNFTSGVAANVNIAHNASGLSEGSNTLWLRVYDGSEYAPTNPSFTLLVDRTQPTVGTITHSPNPVTP